MGETVSTGGSTLILDWDSSKLEKISKELKSYGIPHHTATLRDGIQIGETCKEAGAETFLVEPVLLRGNGEAITSTRWDSFTLPNSILGSGDLVASNVNLTCPSDGLAKDHKALGESNPKIKASATEKRDLKSRIFAAVVEFMVDYHFDISKLSTLHFFSTSGMDSLDLLELADYISKDLNIYLEPTCLIDYPCVQALYNHICGDNDLAPVQQHVNVALGSPMTNVFLKSNHSMGIFNSSRRFPTSEVGEIFKNIPGARDSVKSVPLDRWDPETAQRHSREAWVPRFGSFLENVDMFDAQAWRISIVEAVHMDPQQRLLLEVAAQTLPFPSFAITQSHQFGVFVGASSTDYDDELKLKVSKMKERSPYALTGGSLSVLSGRIAYQFGLQGPALVTDTACSSSMVSAGIALDMLQLNRINDAICGSVNVMLSPSRFLFFAAAGMLSECGRSKTLDKAADGFSRGEAVACFLIKGITNIDQSAHYKLECFLGSISINQDGKSSTLSSPNGPAQTSLIQRAIQEAGCSPDKVSSLCLHGTGTPLGDPIEVNAAFKALISEGERSTALFLVAPKTLLSHSEASAGAVSILYTIHQAYTAQSLVVEHLRSMNNHLKPIFHATFKKGKPSVIPRQNHGWNTLQDFPLTAVSCFASQGTNSHAILKPLTIDSINLIPNRTSDKKKTDFRWCKVFARVFPRRCNTKPLLFRSSRMKQRVEVIDQSGFFQVHEENILLFGQALLFQMSFDVFQFLTSASIAKKCETCIRKCIFLPCMPRPGATVAFEISERGYVSIDILSGAKQEKLSTFLMSVILECNGKVLPRRCISLFNLISQSPSKASISSTQKGGPASMDISHLSLASLSLHVFTLALERTCQKIRHVQSVLICAPSLAQVFDADENFIQSSDQNTSNGKNIMYGIHYSSNKGVERCSHAEATYICEFRAQAPVCPLIGTLDTVPVSNINRPREFAVFLSQKTYDIGSNDFYVNIITNTLGVCQESLRLVGQVHLQAEIHQQNQEVIACHASTLSASPSLNLLIKVTDMERRNKIDNNCHGKAKQFASESRVINVMKRKKASTRVTCILRRKEICMETRRSSKDKCFIKPSIDGAGCIITGGLGGIGGLICQITPEGSIAISRRGYSSNSRISNLDFISIQKCNVASGEDVGDILRFSLHCYKSHHVIHASGILIDAPIFKQNSVDIRQMLTAKFHGSINVSKATNFNFATVVGFSSIAALGLLGSSGYGAANAAMEEVLGQMYYSGINAISIQWGPWNSVGMVASSKAVAVAMASLGVSMTNPLSGLMLIEQLRYITGSRRPVYCFFSTRQTHCSAHPISLLLEGGETGCHGSTCKSKLDSNGAKGKENPVSLDQDTVLDRIRPILLNILVVDSIHPQTSLLEYGADSLMSGEIQSSLSSAFGYDLPSTFLFDFPTLQSMSQEIYQTVCESHIIDEESIEPIASRATHSTSPLILNSVVERFPSLQPHDFPAASQVAKDCTEIAPSSRWDVQAFSRGGQMGLRFGKFIQDCEYFDNTLFSISKIESERMDPQQRILLEAR
eukprot:jgi/Picsp_1/2/NSC_00002-R1_beta-ketoacyl synthase